MKIARLIIGALVAVVAASGCSGVTPRPRVGMQTMATPKSVSPGSIRPAPMAHTAILSPSVMAVKPQSAIQGLNWTQIPGTASSAAAASDGTLWVLSDQPSGPDKYIWHYVGGAWTNISGLASRLSVGPDGTLYAINSGGGAYSYSGGTWTGLGGGCSDVTAAADGSFYVLSNGNSAGSDQAIWHYTTSWSQVPGAGVRIAASWDTNSYTIPSGTLAADGLFVLNSSGSIYYKNPNDFFVQLPGNASDVAPTTIGGVFALGYPRDANGNALYYYDLTTPGWSAQSGSGVSISTDSAHLYVIASTGAIYFTPVNPVAITEYTDPAGGFPGFITTGSDGALWFTEVGIDRIEQVTINGVFTSYGNESPNSDAHGITAGPDGALWFTEANSNKIGRVTTAGVFSDFALPTGSYPTSITTGPDGGIWFAEYGSNGIGRVSTGGTFNEYAIPTANSQPAGITSGPDGAVWFTEGGSNAIGRVTTSGAFTEYPIPSASSQPSGITAGPDGALWFTEERGTGKIGRVTTTGTFTEYPVPMGGNPLGITAGPDGALWFTEFGGDRIGRVTTNGAFTEFSLPSPDSGPFGITTGSDGAIWFTEETNNAIGKIVPGSLGSAADPRSPHASH